VDLNLSLNLPEDFSHLPMVRRVTREALGSFGVSERDVDDLESLVGELAANAVRHARSGDSYRIEVALLDHLATVTVSDHGAGFSRDGTAQPGTERRGDPNAGGGDGGNGSGDRFGGWGLPLVEALADRVEYLPNAPRGTTVRAEKRLRRAAPA
jgi:anti-sigma regulatory factor (Ser/Thr protein kinase)